MWSLVQLLWRTVWRFLKKLEIELPYDPAIPLLGIHTEETRTERDRKCYLNITHSMSVPLPQSFKIFINPTCKKERF